MASNLLSSVAESQRMSRLVLPSGQHLRSDVVLDETNSIEEFPARVMTLTKIEDHRGNLTFVEGVHHIPFLFQRVYYLYDVPAGAVRGGHAHKKTEEFIIAASGSFTVVLDDGTTQKKFFLNRPHYGLYVPPMMWRELEDFSSGSICLVLSSELYDESDYYRAYADFRSVLEGKR
jgi:dTDP-4-dehydrorhamnose 3,5-epimerase-like enzyme